MQEFPATILTRDPTALKETARKAPVTITEDKRPRFVMMSYENYLELSAAKPDQRQVLATRKMPEAFRELALQALGQPYEE